MILRSARALIPTAIVAVVLAASYFVPARVGPLTLTSACSYGYGGAPTVTGVSPSSGPQAGGTSVTITGCGFTGASAVHFGGTPATSVTVDSDSQITATSPAHAPGTYDVTVTTPLGTSTTSPADQFNFTTTGPVICVNASLSSDLSSPQPRGTSVTFTATSGGCTSPVYEWWIFSVRSGWSMLRAYSSVNTFVLNTTSLAPGTYSIDVWVEQSGASTTAYQTFGLESWVVGSCDFATLTPNPGPTSGSIHFTSTVGGSGCGSPQYEFWLFSPGTGWVIKQAYSSTSTFDLDTSTLATGNWTVDMWVKQAATPGQTYETWALSVVPKGACGSTTVGAVPVSPQNGGGTVTFTATADAGCTGAQYEYWIFPGTDGSHWQMLRGYSSSGVFAWNTTGWHTGTYSIDVWVKTTGSTNIYDTYGLQSFSLIGPDSASVSTAPGSPTACCSAVTINASSTRAGSPEYQFWVYPGSGGGWQVIRDWGAGASATWTPPAKGTYALAVYVRQAGAASGDYTWALVSYSAT